MSNVMLLEQLANEISVRIPMCRQIGHHSDWVRHFANPYYDLVYITKGAVEYHSEQKTFTIRQGEWGLIFPGVLYTERAASDYYHVVFAHFEFLVGSNSRLLNEFTTDGTVSDAVLQQDGKLFLSDFVAYQQGKGRATMRLKSSLIRILARIIDYYTEHPALLDSSVNKIGSGRIDRLRPVLRFIEKNLHQRTSTRQLATMLSMSEKYFILYFRQALGITPGKYMHRLRLRQAKQLLLQEHLTVKQTAERLGYSDPYTFSKAFKAWYKVSPGELRSTTSNAEPEG